MIYSRLPPEFPPAGAVNTGADTSTAGVGAGAAAGAAAFRLGAARLREATFFFAGAFLFATGLRAALRFAAGLRAALRFAAFFFFTVDFLAAALVPRFAALRDALRFFVFAITRSPFLNSEPASPPTKHEIRQGDGNQSCLLETTGTRYGTILTTTRREA
jgi:hypothetical protein